MQQKYMQVDLPLFDMANNYPLAAQYGRVQVKSIVLHTTCDFWLV